MDARNPAVGEAFALGGDVPAAGVGAAVGAAAPFAYGFDAPAPWYGVPEAERGRRALLTTAACTIDGRQFFVCGRIEVPVRGAADPFVWSVWVSVSERSFRRLLSPWDESGREEDLRVAGRLATVIPGYPDTLELNANVRPGPLGERPMVELEATAHPLAAEQRLGISLERVEEIAQRMRPG